MDEKFIPLLESIFRSELNHKEKEALKTNLDEKVVLTTLETTKLSIANDCLARDTEVTSLWVAKLLDDGLDLKDPEIITLREKVLNNQRTIEQEKIDSYQNIIDTLDSKVSVDDVAVERLLEENIDLKENEIRKSEYDFQREDAVKRQAIHIDRIKKIDDLLVTTSIFLPEV